MDNLLQNSTNDQKFMLTQLFSEDDTVSQMLTKINDRFFDHILKMEDAILNGVKTEEKGIKNEDYIRK